MKISTFYNTDFVDYGSYDNLRKIASVMDGLKNSSRKIIETVIRLNIKNELKVSQLSNKMAEHMEYLHGDSSGVVVTLAQNFAGTNNLPLLDRAGNFGTRFINEASAPRYIYTNGSKELFNLFNKEDSNILTKQEFEGTEIEPVFLVPSLPLLLINGSEGVSSGFAQKILPRNLNKVKSYLKNKLNNKGSYYKFEPSFNGFSGEIKQGENNNQWIIKGKVEKIGAAKVKITELPIGYTLKSYIKVLNKLEDDKVINSYKDKSSNNIFKFEVNIPSSVLKTLTTDTLLSRLKLTKTVSENYTVIDENNKIKVFNNPEEIFNHYYEVKIKYLQKRKDYIIDNLSQELRYDASKYLFIKGIIDDTITVNKRKKVDIVKDLDKIKDIIQKDNTYDYLLNMSIASLTEERMDKLIELIKEKKKELVKIKAQSLEELWLDDLEKL